MIKKYDIKERKLLHKRYFVFSAIPRTASNTVLYELRRQINVEVLGEYKRLSNFLDLQKNNNFNCSVNHLRLQVAAKKNKKIENLLKTNFCFTFVRNPFDRMVSLYKLSTYNDRPTSMNRGGKFFGLSFSEFVNIYLADYSDIDFYSFKKLNGPLGDSQWKWMHQWLNFIGRYENLEKDFNEVKNNLGLKKGKIQSHVRYYNKIFGKEKEHYSQFYNDDLIEKVRTHYEVDCKLFGYEFNKITKTFDEMYNDVMQYIYNLIKP